MRVCLSTACYSHFTIVSASKLKTPNNVFMVISGLAIPLSLCSLEYTSHSPMASFLMNYRFKGNCLCLCQYMDAWPDWLICCVSPQPSLSESGVGTKPCFSSMHFPIMSLHKKKKDLRRTYDCSLFVSLNVRAGADHWDSALTLMCLGPIWVASRLSVTNRMQLSHHYWFCRNRESILGWWNVYKMLKAKKNSNWVGFLWHTACPILKSK